MANKKTTKVTKTQKAATKKSATATAAPTELHRAGKGKIPEEMTKYNRNGSIESQINIENQNLSQRDLLKAHGFDPDEYIIRSARKSRWQAQGADGEIIEMMASRVTVEPVSPAAEAIKDVIDKIINDRMPEIIKKETVNNPVNEKEDIAAICCIPDLHLGKLCFGKGRVSTYNREIAVNVFSYIINAFKDVLSVEKDAGRLGKIIFYWSQDFMHFDSEMNATARGTKQDCSMTYKVMFDLAADLLVDAVRELREFDVPIEIPYVRSNHDETGGYGLAKCLAYAFADDDMVDIDADPADSYRAYTIWGENLFGFAHGDEEGKRIDALMATEAPEMWGVTKNREFFCGHFHSEQVRTSGAVKTRNLSSPTPPDDWHQKRGYVGAPKEVQIFLRSTSADGMRREIAIPMPEELYHE